MKKIWFMYVHEIALFISDVGMALNSNWLWEKGGNLELWADEMLRTRALPKVTKLTTPQAWVKYINDPTLNDDEAWHAFVAEVRGE